jgi:hypothetical protein
MRAAVAAHLSMVAARRERAVLVVVVRAHR